MDIALMNVRITFQKNEVVTDKIGNHKNAWSDFYSCYATVSGEGGSEKAVAGRLDIAEHYRILIPPNAGFFLMVLFITSFPLTT